MSDVTRSFASDCDDDGFEAGRAFGPFRLVRLLGRGGMGEVWLAEDTRLNRRVALKRMLPDGEVRKQARDRFVREARMAARLKHDNIVAVYEVGETGDGVPYLVMELVEGELLEARLGREPSPTTAEALRLGRELAEGLAFAHENGVIHRDIKPSNIFLEAPTGRVKILDFGLARPVESADGLTLSGVVVGSPGYMSPEQSRGEHLDGRTDLFGLGCVLYRMLAGRAAFDGASAPTVVEATRSREPDFARLAPSPTADLVRELLAKDRDDRPPSASVVAERLREIERQCTAATGELVAVPGPTADRPRARRFAGWAAAAVGLLLVVGVAVAVRGWKTSPAADDDGAKEVVVAPPRVALAVTLWKRDDLSRPREFGDLGVLPLREKDAMRIEAVADRPAFFYAVSIDATGRAWPMYPWRKSNWDDRNEESARRALRLPDSADEGAKVTNGPSGIESVLVFARQTPLTAGESAALRQALDDAPKQSAVDTLRGAVWMSADEQDRFDNDRDRLRGAPSLEDTVKVQDPVARTRGVLRRAAEKLGPVWWGGVCYPFAGE